MRPAPIAVVRGWTGPSNLMPHKRLSDTVAAIACGGFGLSLPVLSGGFFTFWAIQLMEH